MPGARPTRTIPVPDAWIPYLEGFAEQKKKDFPYPGGFKGRGIVTLGGGKYFYPAWVMISMLRHLGCELPVELWYLGDAEMSEEMKEQVTRLENVRCVDAFKVLEEGAEFNGKLGGWQCKVFAIQNCAFKEVLFLDADNVPVMNPEYMFEEVKYLDAGAVFWPDYESLARDRSVWQICGVPYVEEQEFETGQMLINKSKSWKALELTKWINENSDFFYNHIWGDKDTFHMGWLAANTPYVLIDTPIEPLYTKSLPHSVVMCQHDLDGDRLFQHRNLVKFSAGLNAKVEDFWYESECMNYLNQITSSTSAGLISDWRAVTQDRGLLQEAEKWTGIIQNNRFFKYKKAGDSSKILELLASGDIGKGKSAAENSWMLYPEDNALRLQIKDALGGITATLKPIGDKRWKGYLAQDTRYAVELKVK